MGNWACQHISFSEKPSFYMKAAIDIEHLLLDRFSKESQALISRVSGIFGPIN